MTTYSRGMGQVQLTLSHLQQELHGDRASLGSLPRCHNPSLLWNRHIWAEGWRWWWAGSAVWRLGRVWSGAELYSGGALVNGGRSLGHLFLVSRGDCNRPGDFKCFLVYNWLPYCSLNTDFLLAHLFTNHFGIQTTLCKLEALSAEPHIYSLPPLASRNQSASCWQIFLRALTKTRRMSQHSHYSHKDGCCSGNITRAAAQWLC